MDEKKLKDILPDQGVKKLREGHVFKVKVGKSASICEKAREHLKERTKRLMVRRAIAAWGEE